MSAFNLASILSFALLLAPLALAEGNITTTVDIQTTGATPPFQFEGVPAPSATDAGNLATLAVPMGRYDRNGAGVVAVTDGQVANSPDDPKSSFFFTGRGGRLVLDLGQDIDVQQFNTYSWHPNSRAPQVYTLWAASGEPEGLEVKPRRGVDLEQAGWTKLTRVDTRKDASGQAVGGQVGVSIAAAEGELLGSFRYLLMEVEPADPGNRFSNTFYTEVDVVDGNEYPLPEEKLLIDTLLIDDTYEIAFDTTGAPELRGWVNERLKPVVREWYPKLVTMLPSEGFEAPKKFTIFFRNDMQGVAYTLGTEVHCGGAWFRRNLEGEATGAVVHELVHVVQQYRGRRNPGWLVEGLCDYVRWFQYEPADQRPRVNFERDNYDGSYRVTGAFLNYVVSQHGEQVIPKLNSAMRQGRWDRRLWKEMTGKTAPELWAEFGESSNR